MPLKSIDLQTPYFRLFKSNDDLNHLRTYGCLCYVSTHKVLRTKLDPRAITGVFFGYSTTTKGYKVYNPRTNIIQVSRDVYFHETKFPFKIISQNNKKQSQFLQDIFIPSNPINTTAEEDHTISHTNLADLLQLILILFMIIWLICLKYQ